MGKKTYTVTLGVTSLEVTQDPVANNIADVIPKAKITEVSGVYNAKPASATQEEWAYPYSQMTIIHVERNDGRTFKIELQDISNQAAWNTGQKTGLQQAIADINAWL